MQKQLKTFFSSAGLLLICSVAIAQKFSIAYTPASSKETFTGNVFLYLSKDAKHPKDAMVGIEKFPCFSLAVKNIQPNQKVIFNDAALSYPVPLSDIERGTYYVQAVWDRNTGGRSIASTIGNMYNTPIVVKVDKNTTKTFQITCNEVIKENPFTETPYIHEAKIPSTLLTEFYQRPTTINAAVLLPKEYLEQPERTFPVLYTISGFGGDYHSYSGADSKSLPIDTTACIRVFLDGNCSGGHSAYANSSNNGPWGDALTQEFIPAIEKKYRCNKARLLTGHSSGGWTVLWLQTQYPKVFHACWSSAPDPVDFRSFQQIDLYKDSNMIYGKDSVLRMAGTIAGRFPWISMKTMYGMERIIYRGEQMHSFNYVFSTKKSDGLPRELCNPHTGAIDPETVSHWKKYDISLNVRTNWETLKADLEGKIRVSIGNQDNFLLTDAVHLFDEAMKKTGANFVFAYYPGDHFTVSSPEYRVSGNQFLQQKYQELMKK